MTPIGPTEQAHFRPALAPMAGPTKTVSASPAEAVSLIEVPCDARGECRSEPHRLLEQHRWAGEIAIPHQLPRISLGVLGEAPLIEDRGRPVVAGQAFDKRQITTNRSRGDGGLSGCASPSVSSRPSATAG